MFCLLCTIEHSDFQWLLRFLLTLLTTHVVVYRAKHRGFCPFFKHLVSPLPHRVPNLLFRQAEVWLWLELLPTATFFWTLALGKTHISEKQRDSMSYDESDLS